MWLHPSHVHVVLEPSTSLAHQVPQPQAQIQPRKLGREDKASRGSEGDKSRGETLSECLKSLVNSGSKWQDLSRTNEVHFVDGEVVTKYSSIGVDFSLPLLCTDVTWTRIPTPDFDSMQQTPFDRAETEEIPEVKFLIGLAPRWKRLQMAPLECFDEGTDEFWVLCAAQRREL